MLSFYQEWKGGIVFYRWVVSVYSGVKMGEAYWMRAFGDASLNEH
jgi:hypothetical protein